MYFLNLVVKGRAVRWIKQLVNVWRNTLPLTEVMLAQISVSIMHKNLAVHKVIEVMHTPYAKTCSQHVALTAHEANDRRRQASIVKGKRTLFVNNVFVLL